MKNPLLALALLALPALSPAIPIPLVSLAGSMAGEAALKALQEQAPAASDMPKVVPDGTMGPLLPGQCWASQCPPDAEKADAAAQLAAAFNAAESTGGGCTPWRIPCAGGPEENAGAGKGQKRGGGETNLNGNIVTASASGVTIKDANGRTLTQEQTQALLVAHEADTNRGFDKSGGWDPSGQGGRRGATPPSQTLPEADVIGGMLAKVMGDLGSFGDGGDASGQTSTPGQPGPVVYKGEVDTSLTGATSGRVDVDRNIALSRARGALGGLENAAKTGAGLGSTNVTPDETQRNGCDQRNPEMRGLCAE